MNDLIDTPEMYLRTILELHEEGIEPLRARIVERLHQSGPTVSQTVARLGRGHGRSGVLAFSAQDAQPLEIAAIEAEFFPLDRREV